jgi:hypothetical protein
VEIIMVLILVLVFVFAGLIVVFNELFEDLLRTESGVLIDIAKKQAESQRVIEEILQGEVTPQVTEVILHLQRECRRRLQEAGFYDKEKAVIKKRSSNVVTKGTRALANVLKSTASKTAQRTGLGRVGSMTNMRDAAQLALRQSTVHKEEEEEENPEIELMEDAEIKEEIVTRPILKRISSYTDEMPIDDDKPDGGKKKKRAIKFGRNKIRYYSRSDNLGEDGDEPTPVIKFDEDESVLNEAADAAALKGLLGVLDARLFSRWVQEPDRESEDLDACVQIARTLRPFLEDTHALSIYGYDTFWQDLVTKFPVLIDWLLDMLCSASKDADDFEESRDIVFKIFDKIRIFVRTRANHKGNLADGIIPTARAPVFYYLLTEALQEDLDMMNIFLMQMNIDKQHYLSSLTGLKRTKEDKDINASTGLSQLFAGATQRKEDSEEDNKAATKEEVTSESSNEDEKAKVVTPETDQETQEAKKLDEMKAARQAAKVKRKQRASIGKMKHIHITHVEGVAGLGHEGVVYSKEHGEAVRKIQKIFRRSKNKVHSARASQMVVASLKGDQKEVARLNHETMQENKYEMFLKEHKAALKSQLSWRSITSKRVIARLKAMKEAADRAAQVEEEVKGDDSPESAPKKLGKRAMLLKNTNSNAVSKVKKQPTSKSGPEPPVDPAIVGHGTDI